MTLLEDIIDGASGDTPVAGLLRKLKVLAARAGTMTLEEWVDHELNGYSPDAILPSYRGPFRSEVLGNFGGYGGSGFTNAPIAALALPKRDYLANLFRYELRQPISEIENLSRSPHGSPQIPWPANTVAIINQLTDLGETKLNPDYVLHQAWQVVPAQTLVGAADAVRTRILDVALSIERVAPNAGQPNEPQTDAGVIEHIVQMNIYGGNVAIGSANVHQEIAMPAVGDEDQLFAALRSLGLEETEIDELRQALADDAQDEGNPPRGVGKRVSGWLGRTAVKGIEAAGKGAASSAAQLTVKAVAAYFGVV